jgi:hypothetical protein
MSPNKFSLILVILFLLSSCSQTDDSKEIGWSDLIPFTSIFNPSDVKFNKSLNGKVVKIPGYLIPLHYEAQEIKEFMLVPYIGACIHVPPPPANQLVYVISDLPWENDFIWDPIWITGEISIGGQNTIISLNPHETYQANAGYEMVAHEIIDYEY